MNLFKEPPMARGPKLSELVLSTQERDTLERWSRRPKTAQALARRARIILAAADGCSNTVIAQDLKITNATVGKWRKRFIGRRLAGLADEPRPGAPRTISDADVERVVAMTLETKPVDATHWSTRSMAARAGMSQSAVSRIWRAFGLHPHRSGGSCHAPRTAARGRRPPAMGFSTAGTGGASPPASGGAPDARPAPRSRRMD
jgi:transposase